MLSESKNIDSKKGYITSIYDINFRRCLVDSLKKIEINCNFYDGDVDGKFKLFPYMTVGMTGCILLSIFGVSISELYNKKKQKKQGSGRGFIQTL